MPRSTPKPQIDSGEPASTSLPPPHTQPETCTVCFGNKSTGSLAAGTQALKQISTSPPVSPSCPVHCCYRHIQWPHILSSPSQKIKQTTFAARECCISLYLFFSYSNGSVAVCFPRFFCSSLQASGKIRPTSHWVTTLSPSLFSKSLAQAAQESRPASQTLYIPEESNSEQRPAMLNLISSIREGGRTKKQGRGPDKIKLLRECYLTTPTLIYSTPYTIYRAKRNKVKYFHRSVFSLVRVILRG